MRIGIDLGGTKIEAVLLAGEAALERVRVPTPTGDYHGTLAAICALVERLERRAGRPCRVGIGTPGSWVPAIAAMKNCNSIVLNGRPLLHDLEQRLDRQVRLANDADCLALSEARLQRGPWDAAADDGRSHALFAAILGTGVGGGLVVADRLVGGPNGLAGEWGHNTLVRPVVDGDRMPPEIVALDARLDDRSCYCGRRNCIETWLSGPGFARSQRALGGADLTPPDIIARRRTDPIARAALEHYVHLLARALAVLVNVLDPGIIVLGGGLSNIDDLYRRLPALLADHVFDSAVAGPVASPVWHGTVVRAQGGDSSGVLGAARLWPSG